MRGIRHSDIENIDEQISCSTLSISGFVRDRMSGIVQGDYRTAGGIELKAFEPLLEYCTMEEIKRVSSAKSLKRQIEWLCGRIALKELLQSELYPKKDYREIIIDYKESGKPFIADDENISISLTHSGEVAMAAVSLVPGKNIGIDVETIEGIDLKAVLRVAFSGRERDFYADKSAETVIEAFTMKEAYLKVIGKGFHETITRVEVLNGALLFSGQIDNGIRIINRKYKNSYQVSIIYEQ